MGKALLKGTFLGAIVIYLWMMISWMVLPWHCSAMNKFIDEGRNSGSDHEKYDRRRHLHPPPYLQQWLYGSGGEGLKEWAYGICSDSTKRI